MDITTVLTFYGYPDNDPPNSKAIAYPKSDGFKTLHNSATTTLGYHSNPISFAAGKYFRKNIAPIGSKIYVPGLQKYFILEDDCASCSGSWVDLWIGGEGYTKSVTLKQEDKLTPDGKVKVIVNPSSSHTVNAKPLMQYTSKDVHW